MRGISACVVLVAILACGERADVAKSSIPEPAHHWKRLNGDLNITTYYDDRSISRSATERDVWLKSQMSEGHIIEHIRVRCDERAYLTDYQRGTIDKTGESRGYSTKDNLWKYERDDSRAWVYARAFCG